VVKLPLLTDLHPSSTSTHLVFTQFKSTKDQSVSNSQSLRKTQILSHQIPRTQMKNHPHHPSLTKTEPLRCSSKRLLKW
jgi:hypothetical protein